MIKLILVFLFLHLASGDEDEWLYNLPVLARNLTLREDKPIPVYSDAKYINLRFLEGTLYPKSLSGYSNAVGIYLSMRNLVKVEPGAFCPVPSLRKLNFLFFYPKNGTTEINKDSLKNCNNLESLRLATGNLDFEFDTNIFDDLPNLKSLRLHGIKVNPVRRRYFKNLKSLRSLSIWTANIVKIEADAFADLPNLEVLDIKYNQNFRYIPINLLKSTPNLKSLVLVNNNLTALTWDAFEGLSSLEELTIDADYVSSFDAEKIHKNLPNLKFFSFQLNPVGCKERDDFAEELRLKYNNTIRVQYKLMFDSCEDQSE